MKINGIDNFVNHRPLELVAKKWIKEESKPSGN